MKKILFIGLTFLTSISMELQAQDKTTPVTSAITNVTIFLSGAEIQRESNLSVKAGAQQLVFDNLPQNINPQSIQVAGSGNFTILGVSHRINYLKSAEKSKEVESLEQSKEQLTEKMTKRASELNIIKTEEEMLKQNQHIGGTQTGVKTAELKEFADYYRSRITDLSVQTLKIAKDLEEWKKEMRRIDEQLNNLRQRSQDPTSEVVVEITAPAAGQVKLTLTYLAFDAGWTPSYDLRSSDINNPAELIYKANVYQSTGEEWKNIKPVFSTANPTLNSNKPTLMPWYISFYQPRPVYSQSNAFQMAMAPQAEMKMMEAIEADEISDYREENRKAPSASVYTSVQESQTSIEFTVDVPYSIPSDGQAHVVELANHSLPAKYEYYAVRKLEKEVFLVAKVTGWEQLNLLSGPANLFFEGKYVGESYIETRLTEEALSLSLGRDKNITVTRIRKKDFSEKQFLGSNITDTREWDLTVHNKKKQEITITIEDQIPVSTEKDIKVEAVNISQAQLEKETGKLSWHHTLKPSESRTMNVKYTVKYPKDKTVVLE